MSTKIKKRDLIAANNNLRAQNKCLMAELRSANGNIFETEKELRTLIDGVTSATKTLLLTAQARLMYLRGEEE